jgi:hypothetical protein
MRVGVTKDKKLKLRDLHVSATAAYVSIREHT